MNRNNQKRKSFITKKEVVKVLILTVLEIVLKEALQSYYYLSPVLKYIAGITIDWLAEKVKNNKIKTKN